jgi:polyferredoxin
MHRWVAAMVMLAFAFSGQLSGCGCAAAAAMHLVRDHQGDVNHSHQSALGKYAAADHDGCSHGADSPEGSNESHSGATESSPDCGCAGCGDVCSHVMFVVQQVSLASSDALPEGGVFVYNPGVAPAGAVSIFQPPKLVSA